VPKRTKRRGKAAVEKYMRDRAADKPSEARWIYEQAMLQQHAYFADVHAARDNRRG